MTPHHTDLRRFALPRLGWVFLWALAATAILLALKDLIDLDFWWHLSAGRWMWEHKHVVTEDPFSYTFRGEKWVSITWGYEVINYLLYEAAGGRTFLVTAFHALLAACATTAAWLSFAFLREHRTPVSWCLGFSTFLGGLLLVDPRWIHRPEMATHALGGAMLALLFWHRRRTLAGLPPTPFVWLLPVLQILWTNSHGIFMAGPFLVGAFWFSNCWDNRQKPGSWLRDPLAHFFALTFLACAVNPLGFAVYTWPLHLLDVLQDPLYQRSIPEATNALRDGVWRADAWGLIGWGSCLGSFAIAALIWNSDRRQRVGIGYILLTLLLVKLAISARRNISLMVIWSLPWVADYVSGLRYRIVPAAAAYVVALLAQCAVIFMIITHVGRLGDFRLGLGVSPFHYGDGAIDFFRKNPPQGHVFANVELSDYMLFHLPGYAPYIDGRFAELYPSQHFRRFMDVQAHPRLLEEEVKKWDIHTVALGMQNPFAKSITHALAQDSRWRIIYYDESSVVFARTEDVKKNSDLDALGLAAFERIAAAPTSDSARAFLKLAENAFLVDQEIIAKKALDQVFILTPAEPDAWAFSCLQKTTKLDQLARADAARSEGSSDLQKSIAEAESTCEEALKFQSNASIWQALGTIYLNTKRPRDAIRSFQKVIDFDPVSYEGHFMLGQAYAAYGDRSFIGPMRDALERAAELRPYDNEALVVLGGLFSQFGNEEKALSYFEKARSIGTSPELEQSMQRSEAKLRAAGGAP